MVGIKMVQDSMDVANAKLLDQGNVCGMKQRKSTNVDL
jgi:hypothetical protein